MLLTDLLDNVNDSTVVDIYAALTGEKIATYDGKDSIPYSYGDCEVTDIFVDKGNLCIEIDIEPDIDYDEQ